MRDKDLIISAFSMFFAIFIVIVYALPGIANVENKTYELNSYETITVTSYGTYNLKHGNIKSGSVRVYNNTDIFVENTDYSIDYTNGKITIPNGTRISLNDTINVDYTHLSYSFPGQYKPYVEYTRLFIIIGAIGLIGIMITRWL